MDAEEHIAPDRLSQRTSPAEPIPGQIAKNPLPDLDSYIETVSRIVREGLLILTDDLRVKWVNTAFTESFSGIPQEMTGRSIYDVMGGRWDLPEVRQLLEEMTTGARIGIGAEIESSTEGAEPRTLLLSARRLDEYALILLAMGDLTEKENLEAPLQVMSLGQPEDQLLERVLRDLPDMVIIQDVRAHTNRWCNDQIDEILGFRPKEVYALGTAMLPFLVHPADLEGVYRFYTGYGRVEDEDTIRHIECRLLNREGTYRWISTRESIFRRDDEGRVREVLIVGRDVTDRKQGELEREQLLSSMQAERRKFGDLLDHLPLGILLAEESGKLIYWNPGIEEILQQPFIPAESKEDYADWPIFHSDRDEPFPVEERPLVRALEAGETVTGVEMRFRRPDGSWRHVLASAAPIRDEAGQITFAVTSFLDITGRKQAEHALKELTATLERRVEERTAAVQESEARFRALVDASAQIVWATDPAGAAVYDSPSWVAYTGQSFEEGRGWGWLQMVHPKDRLYVKVEWERAVEAQTPVDAEYRLYHAESSDWRWMHCRAVPLYDDDTVRGWVGMHTDITERKRAEQELRDMNELLEQQALQIRELASKLTMAEQHERRRIAQVLHDDLQQRLYGIQIKMHSLRKGAEAGDRDSVLRKITDVEEWLDESIDITRQLSVDLSPPVLRNEGLTDALGWLVTQMEVVHDLHVELKADHRFRMVDSDMRVLLFQIVRELLFNAVKHAGVHHALVQLRESGGNLVIDVVDKGRGFDIDDVATQIEAGDKIGIFSARERIRLFGGDLEMVSAPGLGTRITVRVPIQLD